MMSNEDNKPENYKPEEQARDAEDPQEQEEAYIEIEVDPTKSPSRLQIKALADYLGDHLAFQSFYGATMGFFLYFAMYSLRKPYSVSKFLGDDGEPLQWFNTGLTLKTANVLFQILGYTSSKFLAVKVVSEVKGRQDYWLVGLYFTAILTLILFGVLGTANPNLAPFALFLNGLPLALVWGMVVMYFEGRGGSDFMLVCLSISFIVSSGIVKDVGLSVMQGWGVSQWWMPLVVGLLFGPVFLGCTWGLNQLPPPSLDEAKQKAVRTTMNTKDKLDYYTAYFAGLTALWVAVAFLTAFRDYRDSFSVEIIEGTGTEVVPGTLSKTETNVAGCLLIPIAALVFIKNNLRALIISMTFLVGGAAILIVTVSIYLGKPYDGVTYYMVTGVATYLAYVTYNSVLYERLIAYLKRPCTVGYLQAVMDACGYVGVITIYVVAEYGNFDNQLDVFNVFGQIFGWIMLVCWLFACFYFFMFRRNSLDYVPEPKDPQEKQDVDAIDETENGPSMASMSNHN